MVLSLITAMAIAGYTGKDWVSLDIGSMAVNCYYRDYVGTKGRTSYSMDGIRLQGAGRGLNRSGEKGPDQFRFTYRPLMGEGYLSASLETGGLDSSNGNVGLMIRSSTSAVSPYVFIGIRAGKRLEGCLRDQTGRYRTLYQADHSSLPVRFKLERNGNRISAYKAEKADGWTRIFEVEDALQDTVVLIGYVAVSGWKGGLAEGIFREVRFKSEERVGGPDKASIVKTLQSIDIGKPLLSGVTTREGEEIFLQASGWEIGGTGDSFHFAYQVTEGPREITARVLGLDSVSSRTAGGIMIRHGMGEGSRYVFLGITPGWGAQLSCRPEDGKMGKVISQDSQLEQMPRWLKLKVDKDWVEGLTSFEGVKWTSLGKVKLKMGNAMAIGLAASSFKGEKLITARFDKVSMQAEKVVQ